MPKSFNEFDVSDKPGKVKEIHLMTAAEQASMVEEFHDKRESLLAVDDMVESIVDALGTKIDDTVIVFTSDNGWSQGYHRWVGKQVGYEDSARVPLIIRWPGMPQNETRDQLVTSLDVVATIVDAAKATPGNAIEGHSLIPVLRHANAPWRTAAVLEGGNYPNWGYSQLRSPRISYAEWNSDDYGTEKELYDLAEDPLELKNRVLLDRNRYRKVQDFMGALLSSAASCAGEACWITTPVPDPHPKK
jgi:arylsulfatase A-like enzyme